MIISGLRSGNTNLEYISISYKNCFIKFFDVKSCKNYTNYLASKEFRYKLSTTILSLSKFTNHQLKREAKGKKLMKKVDSPKEKTDNKITKLIESVNQISNNIAKVVEIQNNVQTNHSAVNLFNNMLNRQLEPLNNSNNAVINMQQTLLPQNIQFMLGLMRMQQMFNNNQ